MKHVILASLLALSATAVLAQVEVKDSWVRATVQQQKTTGAFMQLTAKQDARLVEVRSPAASVVEVHEMSMENNVMKMRAVSSVDLPAGKAVELKPGGYHIMLINLKQQIKEGDMVPVTLVVEGKDKKRQTIELQVPARPLNSMAGMKH
ncbi:MAG: copper chaperone PCu(A)C [Glaciimonas sp.]|nr:copper chaperone PCu(A)C [Glaciimonas sp.]